MANNSVKSPIILDTASEKVALPTGYLTSLIISNASDTTTSLSILEASGGRKVIPDINALAANEVLQLVIATELPSLYIDSLPTGCVIFAYV